MWCLHSIKWWTENITMFWQCLVSWSRRSTQFLALTLMIEESPSKFFALRFLPSSMWWHLQRLPFPHPTHQLTHYKTRKTTETCSTLIEMCWSVYNKKNPHISVRVLHVPALEWSFIYETRSFFSFFSFLFINRTIVIFLWQSHIFILSGYKVFCLFFVKLNLIHQTLK